MSLSLFKLFSAVKIILSTFCFQSNTDAQEKVMNHKSCFTPVEAPKSPLAESSFGSSIIKEGTTSQVI